MTDILQAQREQQHATNVLQLTRNAQQLKKCYERTRKNARYLKWFGWFPTAYTVRDAQVELDEATAHLERATATLEAADQELLQALGRES